MEDTIKMKVVSYFLNEFDTELDFTNKVGYVCSVYTYVRYILSRFMLLMYFCDYHFSPTFKLCEAGSPEECLVIIQCDSGHVNGDLIACARNRIYDLKAKADAEQMTHVLFVIHLPHHMVSSSFVGFQGDPWVSSHVDDLRPTTDNTVLPQDVIGATISELFLGVPDEFDTEGKAEKAVAGVHSNKLVASASSGGSVDMRVSSEEMPLLTGDISMSSGEMPVSEEMPSDDEEKDCARVEVKVQDEQMDTEEGLSTLVDDEMVVDDMETEQLASHQTKPSPKVATGQERDVTMAEPEDVAVAHLGSSQAETFVPCTSSPLHRRLHGCIYAAASRLKDFSSKRSTKRVEILIQLIPQQPSQLSGTVLP